MIGILGRLRFGLMFALGLCTTVAVPVAAQTVMDPAEVPACKTTAGDDGLLFHGTFGMVYAPVAFDNVRTEADNLSLNAEIRDGLGVFARGGRNIKDSPQQVDAAPAALVEFIADGTIVHHCAVKIVAFNPDKHDLARLQSGDCDLRLVAGRAPLAAGHAQILEVPQEIYELSIGNPSIADISTLTDRSLYLLGKSPGVTVLAWFPDDVEGSAIVNFCPVSVTSPEEVPDKDLCLDATGVPMRLSVGQSATMQLRDSLGRFADFAEAAVAAPGIADFSFAEGKASATITGLASGSTSLTLLTDNSSIAQNCEIVVE